MIRQLLIPLDGSQLAEQALPVGLAIARHNDAEVKLLRAVDRARLINHNSQANMIALAEQLVAWTEEEARHYFGQLSRAYAFEDVDVIFRTVEGEPASVIVDTAVADKIDLIVMSSHGRAGLGRWILGSVAQRVVRQAPCPVLIMHQPDPIQRILITLDGSENAETALEPGLNLALALKAQVTLFRVAEENDLTKTQAYLRQLADKHGRPGLSIQTLAHEPSPAAEAILYTAVRRGFQAIVMSTHGRAGLTRWLYGSVTERILTHTNEVNLLIVRPSS